MQSITSRVRKQLSPLVLLTLSLVLAAPLYAQTFTVLESFNGSDGNLPGSPILDRAGNIYGSTQTGGAGGSGNVYKLAHAGSGYVLDSLYNLNFREDGAYPLGALTFGPDGVLYGTASQGDDGNGSIFKLQPPAIFCRSITCPWNITILYHFGNGLGNDASHPNGNVVFDSAGNMYGTSLNGGTGSYGAAFELTNVGGTWTESRIVSFTYGIHPTAGVVLDGAGNLYGTTSGGGANGWGTVYKLIPESFGFEVQVLYSFQNQSDGNTPYGGLVIDNAGDLYGSTAKGGQNGGGTIFELSPSNGGWTFNLLYSLSGLMGPEASLTFDAAGNLYGTTSADGTHDDGSVFELSPSNGGWIYTDLHNFTGGSDGSDPVSSVVLDANGNIFGTASKGGPDGAGTVFEIAP
jgi:uncharacterized repeat protein (TIGR03803 family)